jgi:hypothetical protein
MCFRGAVKGNPVEPHPGPGWSDLAEHDAQDEEKRGNGVGGHRAPARCYRVTAWLGNTPKIAMLHYLQFTDSDDDLQGGSWEGSDSSMRPTIPTFWSLGRCFEPLGNGKSLSFGLE